MNDKKHADKAIYKVVIQAPIDTVWSELVNTTSPRPFFWNSSWDTQAMADGNTYRMLSEDQLTVGVVGRIVEIDPADHTHSALVRGQHTIGVAIGHRLRVPAGVPEEGAR